MKISKMFLIALLLVLFNHSEAQLLRSYGIKIGGTAASEKWNYSAAYSAYAINPQTRWGLDVGGFVEFLDIPILSVLTEVHYIQKGFVSKETFYPVSITNGTSFPIIAITSSEVTFSPRVDYISIPILAKISYPFSFVSTYLLIGPRIDIRIANQTDGYDLSILNRTDYGFTFGIGAGIKSILPFELGAEIRYSPSIQNSFGNDALSIQNNSIEFLFVLGF
jgi:hypothetical protein